MKKTIHDVILFFIGGSVYILIEVIWRHLTKGSPTHWTMFFVGGCAFSFIGNINERPSFNRSIIFQGIIGTIFTLVIELVSGCILNLWMQLDVWDYSHMPYNILGQVCPQFSVAWFILSCVAVFLDDWLRFALFGVKKDKMRPA